ncbi:MAG: patatin-like phospholipase family protein [Deltaproteobacteria bacterium]|nr:patatin-like phospholipase family protein [Deltaproteobacteria bacterium]
MKIGIALGGGAAKGFAHIGVLNALAQAGIEFDVVAGTSIGALVGAAYAADSLKKLEEASTKIKLTDIPLLLGPTWPKQGLFSGRKILKLLNEIINVENIEDLRKPFAAVCVDLKNEEIVTFTSGNLHQAIRASIAIPAVFTPVVFEGKCLVDGGVLEPVPVQAARSLGSDFIVAVDLLGSSRLETTETETKRSLKEELWPSGINPVINYLRSIWEKKSWEERFDSKGKGRRQEPGIIDIIQRTSVITQKSLTVYRLKEYPPDFIIRPPLSHVGILDFHRGNLTIKIGEEAAKAILPKLIDEINRMQDKA